MWSAILLHRSLDQCDETSCDDERCNVGDECGLPAEHLGKDTAQTSADGEHHTPAGAKQCIRTAQFLG